MAEIEKRIYIKEKLNNFILFASETFGKDNILMKEFGDAANIDKNGFEPMIRGLLEISKFIDLPMDTEEKKKANMIKIGAFLDFKKLTANDEQKLKMLRYLDLFYKVF